MSNNNIYQVKPACSSQTRHKRKSFTESIDSYLIAAEELSTCIQINERLRGNRYNWFVTVAFEEEKSVEFIKQQWNRVCRKLRSKGLEALWVIEPTVKNTVHFHLIVANGIEQSCLEGILDWSMPDRARLKWHKKLEKVECLGRLPAYITKAKQVHYQDGKRVSDAYATKRMLFKPKIGLRKFGHIGKFWAKPKKAIWNDLKQDKVRRVELLTKDRKLAHLIAYLSDIMVGISRTEIERRLLTNPDCPTLRNWADTEYDRYLESLEAKHLNA